jgi:hypothetical protein
MSQYIPVDYTADSFIYMNAPLVSCNTNTEQTGCSGDCGSEPWIYNVCNGTHADYQYIKNNSIKLSTETCNSIDSDTYYNSALCKNYDLAQQIQIAPNYHIIQNHVDTNNQYLMEYYRTFNLSAGIIGIIAFYFLA